MRLGLRVRARDGLRSSPERAVEARLRGAQRDAKAGRHIGQRHPEEVVQDDDRTPLGREGRSAWSSRSRSATPPEKSATEGACIGVSSTSKARRLRRRSRSRQALTTQSMTQASYRSTSRNVGSSARPEHRFLDRVPRELGVPEDQASGRVQARDVGAGQHGEGVMIAPLRSLDEISLVHGRPW